MTKAQDYLYITTPIFYVNGRPHLGHCYTVIAADILARFWRLAGVQVKFLAGTDEHGAKVAQAAEKQHMSPQAYVDCASAVFKEMMTYVKATNDDFIRTTEPRHKEAAIQLWKSLEAKGQIYLGPYAGWYAVRDEAFYEEHELVEGKAPTGAAVEWIEEPCYFFRLSHWQAPLLAYYKAHPEAIAPQSRYNETLRFIQGGLIDIAISRSRLSWGIPVPGSENHVMYVWIDALTNYISALGYPDTAGEDFKHFWPNSLQLLGKDILRFHSVYWPAFLLAAGLSPPHRLFVHGWWISDNQKMSKSLGNVVDPQKVIADYGLDAFRYFLFRQVPFGQDGSFSTQALARRLNEDLANDFGNLAQRVLSFVHKHTQGKIPALGALGHREETLMTWGKEALPHLKAHMDKQDIHAYLEDIMHTIQEGNRYMAQLAPWELVGTDQEAKMCTGLHVLLSLLRDIAVLLSPVMPEATEKLLGYLGQDTPLSLASVGTPLEVGTPLKTPTALFPKISTD